MTPLEILTIEDSLNGMNLLYKRYAKNFTISIPFVKPIYSHCACLHIPIDIKSLKIQLKITNPVLLAAIPTTFRKRGNWIRLTDLRGVPIRSSVETEIINAYKEVQRMGVAF